MVQHSGMATGKYTKYRQFYSKFIGRGPVEIDQILADDDKPGSLTYAFVGCGLSWKPDLKAAAATGTDPSHVVTAARGAATGVGDVALRVFRPGLPARPGSFAG